VLVVSAQEGETLVSSVSTAVGNGAAALRTHWYQQVERPTLLRSLDSRITLAAARAESYEKRLAAMAQYNQASPPWSQGFSPSDVIPRSESYEPQQALPPVQAFSPRSSFSHVLQAARQQLAEARLELASLQRRKDAALASSMQIEVGEAGEDGEGFDYERRIKAIDDDLKLSQFQLHSHSARLQQLTELRELTYHRSYADLGEKVRLGQLAARLRIEDLEAEKRLLESHRRDWERLRKAADQEYVATHEMVRQGN
jgi:hypothetical protein